MFLLPLRGPCSPTPRFRSFSSFCSFCSFCFIVFLFYCFFVFLFYCFIVFIWGRQQGQRAVHRRGADEQAGEKNARHSMLKKKNEYLEAAHCVPRRWPARFLDSLYQTHRAAAIRSFAACHRCGTGVSSVCSHHSMKETTRLSGSMPVLTYCSSMAFRFCALSCRS